MIRRWVDDAVVALVLAGVAATGALAGWTWRLDRLVYDRALAWWTPPPPPGVLVVAIDDASVEAIGRWPWPRAVHATLLERLAAARPRAIALDLLLSEPDPDPRQDELLARAMAHAGRVVLPIAWRFDETRGLLPLAPVEPLRPFVTLGAVDPATDADGVLRHGFVQAGPAGHERASLARALLEAGGEAIAPGLRPVFDGGAAAGGGWRRDGRFATRFAGPAGTVETVSYVDVLRGALPPERLAGRYLLVGATAQGLGDRQPTPVDGGGPAMNGIEVLANELATLRSGHAITEVDGRFVAAASVLALGLLIGGMTRAGPRRALALSLGAVPVAIAASFGAMRAGLWFAPMPFAVAALLAYPLWSWRRLERAMLGIDREIDALGQATRQPTAGDAIGDRLQVLREAAGVVREARRFLAEAVAALPTAVLVADGGQRVLLANERAAALFEVGGADELAGLDLGRLLQELSTPEAIDWPAALAALDVGGPGMSTEARLGESVDVVLSVAAIGDAGERRFIATLADIEPVRRAEREREEALAFVSHDLRAPAGSIVLLADMSLQGALDTPRDELLAQVRQLAARTLALADAFVRASRAGSQAIARTAVELPALVDEALLDLRPTAAARGVRIELAVEAARVAVDRFLLARALGNLVANAIRHSPASGTVRVEAAVSGGRLRLRVADQGPGLSAQQAARLGAGDAGLATGSAQGVGLGLLFVQRVAQRHGGRLRALPAARGTTLEIEADPGQP